MVNIKEEVCVILDAYPFGRSAVFDDEQYLSTAWSRDFMLKVGAVAQGVALFQRDGF